MGVTLQVPGSGFGLHCSFQGVVWVNTAGSREWFGFQSGLEITSLDISIGHTHTSVINFRLRSETVRQDIGDKSNHGLEL